MNIHKKSTDELMQELLELKEENAALKALYEKDIAERKLAEDALRERTEELDSFFSNALDLFCIANVDGYFIRLNKQWEATLGYKLEDLQGHRFLDFVHPDDLESTLEAISALSDQEVVLNFENRYRAKDGTYRTIEWRSIPKGRLIYAAARDMTEQKKSEEELQESKEHFELVFNTRPDTTLLTRLDDGVIVNVNEGFISIMGYSKEEAIGKSTVELNLWKYPEERHKMVDTVHLKGFIENFEVVFQSKNGSQINCLLSARIIMRHGVEHIISVIRDITDRKQIEIALRESQEIFNQFMNNSPVYIFFKDENLRTIRLSKNYEEMLGKPIEELIGKSMYEIFPPDFAKRMVEDDKKALIEGKAVTAEVEFNGRVYTTVKFPIEHEGKPRYLAGYTIDITDRKQSDEKLRALSQAIKQSPASIVITDIQGNIQFVNKKFIEVTGYTYDEVIGKSPRILKSSYHSSSFYKEMWEAILAGNEWHCEFKNIKKNGDVYWENALIAPIFDKKGKIIQLLAVKEDITARKAEEEELIRLNEELRLSNEFVELNLLQKNALIEELTNTKDHLERINSEKDKFFSIIAHDLKSPFSGFLGLTKFMAEEIQNITMRELQDFSHKLQDSASNLYKLLENLLEWSRMQRGATQFNPEMCRISFIIKQNIDIVSEFSRLKKIDVINEIPDELQVTADVPMLNTVLRNLISNAIKFTPKGGTIKIGSKPTDNLSEACLFVKDSGIGMDNVMISKLFKIDEKVSRPGTEGESSTGLGLLLCKDFIEKHGGKIWVESEENKGSTFYFSLPL